KDNFYIISIEIVFFSLIQELYVPDSILLGIMSQFLLILLKTMFSVHCDFIFSKVCIWIIHIFN
ncbi:hypothetical protein, partial [Staphylococcus hominis]|uniref:hypothetical protein n=1 Tax=Staphylococcus hominis TaxID=1290 RepID=UPI003D29AB56